MDCGVRNVDCGLKFINPNPSNAYSHGSSSIESLLIKLRISRIFQSAIWNPISGISVFQLLNQRLRRYLLVIREAMTNCDRFMHHQTDTGPKPQTTTKR